MPNHFAIGVQENFEGGWAIIQFTEKPHYWVANGRTGNTNLWRSACGTAVQASNESVPPLVVGNFPKCKLCLRSKVDG